MFNKLLTIYHSVQLVHDSDENNANENIVGKEENAGHQDFLLFSQCFLPLFKTSIKSYVRSIGRLQVLSIRTRLGYRLAGKSSKVFLNREW